MENDAVKWEKARENAEITFQRVYLPKVLGANHPPKTYVCLEGEDPIVILCYKPDTTI